jgi:phosphatidyl-myo-inositol alpha-mannosyltransferase
MPRSIMKIGFVLDDTLDSTDGVQQYVLTLGKWLKDQGQDVHYLVGATKRRDIPAVHSLSRNMSVRFNGNRMSMPLPAKKSEITALLSTEEFDVLHVQVPYSPLLAHRVIMAAPPQTAIIGTFHIVPNSALVSSATRLLATVSRPSLERFDTMFSVSKAAEEFVKRTHGIKTEILPNVVETSRFSSAEKFVEFADKPTIVFLGRLVPRKGCQILLEAVRDIVNNGARIPFRVVICGRGPLEQSLKSFVSSHRLETYVQFTGYVSEDDKPRYFASADLAVFPSTGGESFGIVLLEAMAADAVVLGADNPGYHSVLAPSPESLCKVADAEDLAKKIQTLLEDTDARRRILKWQSSHIRQFDVAVVGVQLGYCYDQRRQVTVAPRQSAACSGRCSRGRPIRRVA